MNNRRIITISREFGSAARPLTTLPFEVYQQSDPTPSVGVEYKKRDHAVFSA